MQSVSVLSVPFDIQRQLDRLAAADLLTAEDVEFVLARFTRDTDRHWRDLLAEIEQERPRCGRFY